MISVTRDIFPNVHAAFLAIERDNGGHLIGTVYPGERLDLATFKVPPAWGGLLPSAEAGLAGLAALSSAELETFIIGEHSEAEAICERQGNLGDARKLLNDYFDGWQKEDAPQ